MFAFSQFLKTLFSDPLLFVCILLIGGTIFVNGATDAANSIAEAVGTRSITFGQAVALAAACEFLGLVMMTLVSTAVADTMSGMVDFGDDTHAALVALAAASVAIVVWAVAAWAFGIPTSESHALIAGLTGAAIAVSGGLGGVNASEWAKVLFGLVFSTGLGFLLGFCITKLIQHFWADSDYRSANVFFGKAQVVGTAFGAFMHGAQDGQKFMSTAMMAVFLSLGQKISGQTYPLWLMLGCAAIVSAGTAVGGKKIVSTVGSKMVQMEKYQGAAASLSAALSLLASSLWGLPVSTTHTKSSAIMGSGAAKNVNSVNWGIAKDMVTTWVLTFPGCGLIGFVLTKVFLLVF